MQRLKHLGWYRALLLIPCGRDVVESPYNLDRVFRDVICSLIFAMSTKLDLVSFGD